jgi:hypothetical protein
MVSQILESLEMLSETLDELMDFVWECRYFKPLKEFYDEAKRWVCIQNAQLSSSFVCFFYHISFAETSSHLPSSLGYLKVCKR